MSYAGEARFRFNGPADVCSRYIPIARVLVERTMAMYDVGGAAGAGAATNSKTLEDGTIIKVTVFEQVPPIITITAGTPLSETKYTDISNGFWFYCTGDSALVWGGQYIPGIVLESYMGNDDDGGATGDGPKGEWVTRKLPELDAGTSDRQGYYRYVSPDLRVVDNYPRWVCEWQPPRDMEPSTDSYDGSPFGLEPWNEHYFLNGKKINAPGKVVGAVKALDVDAVFTIDETSMQLTRHDWVSDLGEPGWKQAWSVSVDLPSPSTAVAISGTMQIKPDASEAVFVVAGEFDATTSSSESATCTVHHLMSAALDTGSVAHVYGDTDKAMNTVKTAFVSAEDGDFPDSVEIILATTSDITAGSSSSVGVESEFQLNENSNISSSAMPRVGDKFSVNSTLNDVDYSSTIEITSVSFTPEPYTDIGSMYSGSIEPHKAMNGTIGFVWGKIGGGVGTPITYSAGAKLYYINAGDATSRDYYSETGESHSSEVVGPFYGYDLSGAMIYTIVDAQYIEDVATSVTGGSGSMEDTVDYTSSHTATLRVVGGEHDGLEVVWCDEAFDFNQVSGISDFQPISKDSAFSGVGFLFPPSGTIGPQSYTEYWYPATDVGLFDVFGAGTDKATTAISGQYDIFSDALYREDYGFVYLLKDNIEAASIESLDDYRRESGFRYKSSDTTATGSMPYKDIFKESITHKGVVESEYIAVTNEELGSGSETVNNTYTLSGTTAFAASSFDASSGLRAYKDDNAGIADTYPQVTSGGLASDPFNNVVALFNRGFDEYILRSDDYGYLWRPTEEYSSSDPRSLFAAQGASLPESAYGVYWPAIVTDIVVTTEKVRNENPNEEKDITRLAYLTTYRLR